MRVLQDTLSYLSKIKKISNRFLFLSVILMAFNSYSQEIPIGQWRAHLPFHNLTSIARLGNVIYGANASGLLYYDGNDNSLNRMTRVEGLSDVDISIICASEEKNLLIIAYENGNIDILKDGDIFNIPDIKRANILGSKTIHNVRLSGDYAYLSTGFGIVKFDLNEYLIRESYYFGAEGQYISTYDAVLTPDFLYAATESGLYRVLLDANMADYTKWEAVPGLPYPNATYNAIDYFAGHLFTNLHIESLYNSDTMFVFDGNNWDYFSKESITSVNHLRTYNNTLVVTFNGGIDFFDQNLSFLYRIYEYQDYDEYPEPNDALIDQDNYVWIADGKLGLVKTKVWSPYINFITEGPLLAFAYDMSMGDRTIWVATGGTTGPFHNQYRSLGLMKYKDYKWKAYHKSVIPALDTVIDFVHVCIDPSNPDRAYGATWGQGVYVFNQDGIETVYNHTNSSLQRRASDNKQVRIGGTAFDKSGNLWVSNSETERPVSVRTPDGQWISFGTEGKVPANTIISKIMVDSYNQKWVILGKGVGILVLKESGFDTPNDVDARVLTAIENQGGLPSSSVYAIVEDLDNNIWIGTDKGATVIYNPQGVTNGNAVNAQQILVELGGFYGPLLESELVTCIAVDGANKKWFGTERSGVFLMSSDGRTLIQNFNSENSPLLSNNVTSIVIDDISGEVYFGTDKGIISYRALATKAGSDFKDVLAFPNPVREDYYGPIAIKGLVRDANVKITDISGNLIFETIAEGGQAIWDGKKLNGQRPASGVYLVFVSNDDGSQTMVTKILFVN